MTREEQIKAAASAYTRVRCPIVIGGERFNNKINSINANFIAGAEWADKNPKSSWISVEERLPDRHPAKFMNWSKKVFVVVKRGRECCTYVDEYSHIYNTWRVFGDEVTHWMPIPELPKEE